MQRRLRESILFAIVLGFFWGEGLLDWLWLSEVLFFLFPRFSSAGQLLFEDGSQVCTSPVTFQRYITLGPNRDTIARHTYKCIDPRVRYTAHCCVLKWQMRAKREKLYTGRRIHWRLPVLRWPIVTGKPRTPSLNIASIRVSERNRKNRWRTGVRDAIYCASRFMYFILTCVGI